MPADTNPRPAPAQILDAIKKPKVEFKSHRPSAYSLLSSASTHRKVEALQPIVHLRAGYDRAGNDARAEPSDSLVGDQAEESAR